MLGILPGFGLEMSVSPRLARDCFVKARPGRRVLGYNDPIRAGNPIDGKSVRVLAIEGSPPAGSVPFGPYAIERMHEMNSATSSAIAWFVPLAVFCPALSTQAAPPPQYHSTLIDGVGIFDNSHSAEINASGMVVGYLTGTIPPSAPVRGFLFDGQSTIDIGDVGQATCGTFVPYVEARSINDAGDIVGYMEFDSAEFGCENHGFILQNGVFTDLFPLVDARDINNNGQMVGLVRELLPQGGFQFIPVFWDGGVITEFGSPPGAASFFPWSVSNSGVAVGYTSVGQHPIGLPINAPFLWENGQFTQLNLTFAGDDLGSVAFKMTDNGLVLGESHRLGPNGQTRRGIIWQNGQITDVINPFQRGAANSFWAVDINSSGDVVGISWDVDGGPFNANRAALYHDGVVWDLNLLVPPNDPAAEEMYYTAAINEAGVIVTVDWIGCCGRVLTPQLAGDGDFDGDLDLDDHHRFSLCSTGPDVPFQLNQCDPVDFDHDMDVDLGDFQYFQIAFGSGQ
jgi:uncharacterized membrane protein